MDVIALASAVAQVHFTLVTPLGIVENQSLDLGKINNRVSGYCQLDSSQRQGSGCVESDNRLAQFLFSGTPNAQIQVILHPVTNSSLTFMPLLPNGSQAQTFSLAQGPLMVEIGARLDITDTAALGEQSISYTIEVNYL